ncbi:fatty acid synthase [Danaus plexippus]|uniref:Fatty acid synthase n=1 Tax=Danaus plexippus plexippus TaxID=278856 RepID=A0A212FMU5_DANPL|nr:fatty acid synthase [Danaus plexippus]OWR55047.1 p270 [Danaus plexippus plexippus]
MAPSPVSEDRLTSGHRLSHPPPGDEVLITGISGYFPDSDSVLHLQENLFNKVDLISGDARRWKLAHPEIPQRTGKINNVNRFDASFFGVHFKQAHTMDPMCRILLEKAYEAVIDAGLNPKELRGTKTGVFIGACFSESEKTWFYEKMQVNGFGVTGCSRAMLANRISYWLGVTGPSYTVDSACSSSLYALEHAFRAIRDGHCDAAIVGGSNLCLHPYVSLQFSRLGVLSADGRCKSFDNSANGYARSEAIVVCLLQKAKDSRRVYAQVLHAKTNCDGYKEQGITYPAGNIQKLLLNEFYEECSIPPNTLEFVEAHGTGTRVGDPEELVAIEDVFCTGRSEPLMIGSIKSNLGHSEPASGLCSIAKLCIAYSTGYIPPNLHFTVPREGVKALSENRLKVITQKHPWNRGMSGINSFGFGGANAHTLLKNVAREKVNNGIPSDDLPRLVCVSGRTESAVAKILDDLESRTVDAELIRLLHAIHDDDITGHVVRGYSLLESTPVKSKSVSRDIQYFSGVKRPVWFVYSGMGSQWAGMATQLMRIPVFAAAINKCHKALEPKGVNLIKTITDPDPSIYDNILNSFIGIAAVQIGLTDVLKAVGIEPDFIIGHSVGELGCAYADGCFTAEQMILSAYSRGLASIETPFIKGSMAAVGLGYAQIKSIIPPEIEVACHNGPDSSTISGPAEIMKSFVAKLVAQGVFAKEVPCSNIAYHSKYIADAGPKLLQYLREVIPQPKSRSERWVSTSVPQMLWKDPRATLSSAEYHTNNLLSPVLFEETARLIPGNAITIEIAPHGLLQAILRRSLKKDVLNIPLTEKKHADNVQYFLTALGKLYEAGLNPHLANIYPHVPFPVSQGTPMLSHLVEWEHSEDWYVTSYKAQDKMKSGERTVRMSIVDEDSEFMAGHVIDGRNLYPATGYLVMVWETLGMMLGELYTEVSVVFENVRFQRATNIPKDGNLEFIVMIQKGSGQFEIVESGASIVTGRIYSKKNVGQDFRVLPASPESSGPNVKHLLTKDFYKELRLRGYQYSGLFRGIIGCNVEGTRGRLAWQNNWVAFMDCMLQLKLIGQDTRGLFVPTRIERLSIDANMHYDAISKMNPDSARQSFEIRVYPEVEVIRAGGVEIRGLHATPISRKNPLGVPVLEKNVFVPNFGKSKMKIEDILRANIQLVLENIQTYKVKAIEVIDEEYKTNNYEPIMEIVGEVLGDLPLIQADMTVFSEEPIEMPSNIVVENKKATAESNTIIYIGANLLRRPEVLKPALSTLRDKGFLISREKDLINPKDFSDKFDIISIQDTGVEYLVLFRKRIGAKPAKFIKIVTTDDTYSWIDKVKEELKVGQKLVLYNEDEPINGLLGLVNCLRREPGGEVVHGLLIADPSAPAFNPDLEFYEEQLDKDMALNVYQDGQWGTYRHLLLGDLDVVNAHHAFVNTTTIGDLSTLKWLEGPIRENTVFKDPYSILIHVYCAALNFRDVMTAMGRVTVDAVARGRLAQECVQGFEVVGRTCNGSRVMAMVRNSGMANMIEGDKALMWNIPDEWTFEEAASVPVAYGTVYYAMVMVARVQRGESVLIHAGSGGVGQAAINVALHYGCEVFTTVGTPEKRAFIKKLFPQLKDSHIGNSRDTSFEDMIRKETKGKGVDIVLNSLADEKLQASVRCLGYRGRFLEIGKFDISNNTPIGMYFFLKETSFHGIMLDFIFDHSYEFRKSLQDLLLSGIESGAVRPLTYCTFEKHEIEAAFRYMAAGKHIGKVIIKIRDEERSHRPVKPVTLRIPATPRYMCMDDYVYVVVGGLGGFGLELTDWLILRGARRVLLTSRRGVSNGYQASRLRTWAQYKADVQVSTHDITTEEGCQKMLEMANSMGKVEAIFNLAVILKDSIFQNQTPETFKISFGPKAKATMNLDKLSRKLCPGLKDFVIFSSVSCGRGNAGQTNYGYSNSVMERICEWRHKLGLPALAVQWGAVGDVGLVADMQDEDVQLEIGGTLQQRISSCLLSLDKFLKQDAVIVSSIVVAEKKAGGSGCGNIVDAVAQIMGIKDLKTVSQQVSLAELGMDSMMAVEIKQTLEREFEIFLTAQDIRTLTFARLVELTAIREAAASTSATPRSNSSDITAGLRTFIRNFGNENLATEPFIYMPTMVSDGTETDVSVHEDEAVMFMLPGLEGCAAGMAPLCKRLKIKICALQFGAESGNDTLDDLVNSLHQKITSRLIHGKPYILLGYSFGTLPLFKLASILESEGHSGTVFCIDGSPEFLSTTITTIAEFRNDKILQNSLICYTIDLVAPNNDVTKNLMEKLHEIESYDERIDYGIKICPVQHSYSHNFIRAMSKACYNRTKMIFEHNENDVKKINAPVILLRPKEIPLPLEDNYGLDKYTEGPVTVHYLEGNHVTIIENKDCANIINKIIGGQDKVEKDAPNVVTNMIEQQRSVQV